MKYPSTRGHCLRVYEYNTSMKILFSTRSQVPHLLHLSLKKYNYIVQVLFEYFEYQIILVALFY